MPVGVEALEGLQQAEVALLDEVEHVCPLTVVLEGHLDDQPQVRCHQALTSHPVVLDVPASGEVELVFGAQEGGLSHLRQVDGQRVFLARAGDRRRAAAKREGLLFVHRPRGLTGSHQLPAQSLDCQV